jgi:1-phosphofructokinase family hexose kinase
MEPSDDFSLHVVGPNPAQDRLQVVPEFRPFDVNRASTVQVLAGGKGMIVCRASRRLGATVVAHGFVGGVVGDVIRQGCRSLGVTDRHVQIAGQTRTTLVVVDTSSGRSTVVNEPGPEVDSGEVEALLSGLTHAVRRGDVVVSTGSLPVGCPADLHAKVARIALASGAIPMVDAAGDALRATVDDLRRAPAPVLLKVNADELGRAVGADLRDLDDLRKAATHVAVTAGATVVVTRGAAGALWRSEGLELVVSAPRVEIVNSTGSGDCFLAGLATALGRRQAPESALMLASAMGAANAATLRPDVQVELVQRLMQEVVVAAPTATGGVA